MAKTYFKALTKSHSDVAGARSFKWHEHRLMRDTHQTSKSAKHRQYELEGDWRWDQEYSRSAGRSLKVIRRIYKLEALARKRERIKWDEQSAPDETYALKA